MKQILRKIDPYENNNFSKIIRGRLEYASVMLVIMRKILDNSSAFNLGKKYRSDIPYLKLFIDKQSRVFVYLSPDKFYSMSFPCTVSIDMNSNNVNSIYTLSGVECSNKTISEAIAVLSDIKTTSIVDVYESRSPDSPNNISAYKLIDFLWSEEPCYIRYDFDVVNNNGKKHPLNHLDINFTSRGTYKFGLNDRIVPMIFEDIIDSQSDCYFLNGKYFKSKNIFSKNKQLRKGRGKKFSHKRK